MRPDQMPRQPFRDDQDLAWLSRDVRVAASVLEAQLNFHHREQWHIIRAELVRLARENAELREALHDDSARIVRECDDERAIWKQRAERAEAELAAFTRWASEACSYLVAAADGSMSRNNSEELASELLGELSALLPVGGE